MAQKKKKSSAKRYWCFKSVWPGFKPGGGGAGMRCYDFKSGRIVKNAKCKACPTAVRASYGKGGYRVSWKSPK
jgi:hypothetical protein